MNYACVCKETRFAVESSQRTIWRSLFAKEFDVDPKTTSVDGYRMYKARMSHLKYAGKKPLIRKWLRKVRDIITGKSTDIELAIIFWASLTDVVNNRGMGWS